MPIPELRGYYLSEAGDGTGPPDAIGDYSATPGEFWYAPSDDQTFLAKQLIVALGDGGQQWLPERYGAIDQLDPGIKVSVQNPGGEDLVRLDAGVRVVCNACWVRASGDTIYATTGASDDYQLVIYDFVETHGVYLPLTKTQRLVLTLEDDLSELSVHRFFVKGFVPRMDKRRHSWDESVGLHHLDP